MRGAVGCTAGAAARGCEDPVGPTPPRGFLRVVPEVRAEPALGFLEGHALARGVVFDLIAVEAAHGEVAGPGVTEIEAEIIM